MLRYILADRSRSVKFVGTTSYAHEQWCLSGLVFRIDGDTQREELFEEM